MILAMLEKFYVGELVFLLLACGAAWMTGRAVASVWQPLVRVVLYGLLLAWAVRFLHFALYQGPFISVPYYIADYILLTLVGILAYRYTRTNQMVTQYSWMYERASPLSWRNKA